MNYTYYRRYRPQPKRRPNGFKAFFWLVVVLVGVLLLLQACVRLVTSFVEEKKDEATLTVNEGSAEVLEWGQSDASPAADAQLLLVGDTVTSDSNSLVTLRFADDMEVHLDENSKLLFEDAEVSETKTVIHLELLAGRAWVDQESEEPQLTLQFKTKTMNLESTQGRFLIGNQDTKQYAYSFEGNMTVNYVDRAQDDSVIETVRVEEGKKSILTSEAEVALLARESLVLLSDTASDEFEGDRFVLWNLGTVANVGTSADDEEESDETEENIEPDEDSSDEENADTEETSTETPEEAEVPAPTLCVSVTSPGLTVTIEKDAIAIEGSITCGTASTVTVTWGGNNSPYTLGGFAPGDTTFRYVADAAYENLKAGTNTYTIVATAADGTQSAPVTVTITANY